MVKKLNMVTIPKVLVVCSLLVLPFFAFGKTEVFLDEETISQGYTITEDNFSLGILPNTLAQSVEIEVKATKKYTEPKKRKIIGDVYVYNIKTEPQEILSENLEIGWHYEKNSSFYRRLAYWDRQANKWQSLDTDFDRDRKIASSSLPFPYAIIALLENRHKPLRPARNIDYNDFLNDATDIDSEALVVMDEETKKVLWKKNAHKVWPIASLTKLMTAYVFLQTNPDLDEVVTYHASNDQEGARLYVYEGETMTLRDLFYSMLVGSANNAAYALVEYSGLTLEEFVARMNQQAKEWHLEKTQFTEPSGLEENNVSTAKELAILSKKVLQNEKIYQATTTESYYFSTLNTGNPHTLRNSNHLLTQTDLLVTGGKTGYIDESLYNLMTRAKKNKHNIIAVVLGNPDSEDRFNETYALINWAFDNWTWAW